MISFHYTTSGRSKKESKGSRSVRGRMHFFSLVVLLLVCQVQPSEGRFGSLRTRTGKLRIDDRPQITYSESEASILLLDPPDAQQGKTIADGSSSRRSATPSASIHTDVGDLATRFKDAMQAINQDENGIHVGRLLIACERLETTMRKIGFNQGAKDIGGNINKIRNMYNKAPQSERDSMPALLKYEIDSGIHGVGRRLKDPSAAMGFLWLGRTLTYQYDLFRFMLDENEEPYDAARHAYDQDLKHHHSWAVQKVCKAAMVSLKPMKRTSVLSSLGGFQEESFGCQENEATNRDVHQMMDSWKPMLSRWRKVFSDLDLENI